MGYGAVTPITLALLFTNAGSHATGVQAVKEVMEYRRLVHPRLHDSVVPAIVRQRPILSVSSPSVSAPAPSVQAAYFPFGDGSRCWSAAVIPGPMIAECLWARILVHLHASRCQVCFHLAGGGIADLWVHHDPLRVGASYPDLWWKAWPEFIVLFFVSWCLI